MKYPGTEREGIVKISQPKYKPEIVTTVDLRPPLISRVLSSLRRALTSEAVMYFSMFVATEGYMITGLPDLNEMMKRLRPDINKQKPWL